MNSTSPNSPRGLDFLSIERCHTVRLNEVTIRLWTLASRVMISQVEGTLTVEGAMALGQHLREQSSAGGRFLAFHDWKAMTDYNDVARAYLLDLVRGFSQQLEAIHILVHSSVVEFGVRAANFTIKNLQIYSVREEFEDALREALHGAAPATA
jgi:hypothetical protein